MPTAEETAAAEAAATAAAAATTALAAGQEKPESWIPEKYQVRKDGKKDGQIDVEASARALAKGYGEATKRMVDVGLPPEDPDKYELGGEGLPKEFDVAEFRKDPGMQDFLKGAHSLGLTNKQVNYVVGKYLAIAPEIAGAAAELSNEECVAQLALTWKSDAEMVAQTTLAHRATTKLATMLGMTYDDLDAKYGNDPIFIRLAAALAPQMGEDAPPLGDGGTPPGPADFEDQVKVLRAELDKIPERNKKDRDAVKVKIDALYAKRYGSGQRAPFFSAGKAA